MRKIRYTIIASYTILAACGDPGATSPARSVSPTQDVLAARSGTVSFSIDPQGSTIDLGAAVIVFPANAVCDPAAPGYRYEDFDAPCKTITSPITLSATMGPRSDGGYAIDFSRELRFNPEVAVTLSTSVFGRLLKGGRGYREIGLPWVPSIGGSPVHDSPVTISGRTVSRRIRHFSGYSMTSGQPCIPDPSDPDCIEVGNGGR